MPAKRIPKTPFFILIILFILFSAGTASSFQGKTIPLAGYELIPSNSTVMVSASTPIGEIYAFSDGNNSAAILPTHLPTLILDRGLILQDLNLSGVNFSLYDTFHGVEIFEVGGINASRMSLYPLMGTNETSPIPFPFPGGTENLFVSDTVQNFVFLGTIGGVDTSIMMAGSGNSTDSFPSQLNSSANFSAYSSLNTSSTLRSASLNSSGNQTTVTISFRNYNGLDLFRAELLSLELAGGAPPFSVSVKGLKAEITFHMDLQSFMNYLSNNRQSLSLMGLG